MNELYNRLLSGESAEDIVAAFTKELNDAEARLAAERAEAEAASAKKDEARDLARAYLHFFKKYGAFEGDAIEDKDVEETADYLVSLADATSSLLASLREDKIEDVLGNLFKM